MGNRGIEALVVVIVLVIFALKFMAIAAGIALVALGLFYLFKWLYIGWVKTSKADPLFTQAAKEVAKTKQFDPDSFKKKNNISEERVTFIISQLRYAGILSDNKASIGNEWMLRPVFKQINREEDYFLNRVNERATMLEMDVDRKLLAESEAIVTSLLRAQRDGIRGNLIVEYLSAKLKSLPASAFPEEVDKIKEQIKDNTVPSTSLSISESVKAIAAFKTFKTLIEGVSARIWDSKHHELKFKDLSYNHILINGQEMNVPSLRVNSSCYYFYPSFIILDSRKKGCNSVSIQILQYGNISLKTRTYFEQRGSWFESKDAEISETTWLHTCRNGSPDLRYSYNPAIVFYHFYAADFSGTDIGIISGSSAAIENIKNAFMAMKAADASILDISMSPSGFEYLKEHSWKSVAPSDIVLNDSIDLPEWHPINGKMQSCTVIETADDSIQQAYTKIRKDFLNGVFYDLSGAGMMNYGVMLFYDLFTAYANGYSDIQTLCSELDILTISCSITESLIQESFNDFFNNGSQFQADREYVNSYFSLPTSP